VNKICRFKKKKIAGSWLLSFPGWGFLCFRCLWWCVGL